MLDILGTMQNREHNESTVIDFESRMEAIKRLIYERWQQPSSRKMSIAEYIKSFNKKKISYPDE